MHMEFLAIIGAIAIVVFIFKKLTSSTNSDKLTMLQLENWIPMYSNGSLFQKSNMATALVVQSIHMANGMGINISVNEFMHEKNKNKECSMDVVNQWLDYIFSEMVQDIPASQLNALPARTVGAMMIVRLASPSRYRELLRG